MSHHPRSAIETEPLTVIIRDATVGPRRADVVWQDGVVADITGPGRARAGSAGRLEELDVAGAAVLPGLHDHHIHLASLAAARLSAAAAE